MTIMMMMMNIMMMIMMILTSEVLCCCRVLEPSHVVLPDQERLRGAVQGHCRYRGQRLVGGD